MRAVKQSDTQIFHVPMLESKAFEITPSDIWSGNLKIPQHISLKYIVHYSKQFCNNRGLYKKYYMDSLVSVTSSLFQFFFRHWSNQTLNMKPIVLGFI